MIIFFRSRDPRSVELAVGNVPAFHESSYQTGSAGKNTPYLTSFNRFFRNGMTEIYFSIPELRIFSYGTTTACGVLLWILEGFNPCISRQQRRDLHAKLNLSMAGINLLILLPSGICMAFIIDWSRKIWPGIGMLALHPVAEAILIILLIDLWMYFWHRLNHETALLWRFHSIHHSDPSLDVTTSWRFHYVEILLSELLRLPLFMLLGAGIEHLLLYSLLMTPVIEFHHSNVSIPPALDRLARLIIPTPMMHRLHHSRLRNEHDSNYGSMLSLWDRLFGSFLTMERLDDLQLGLDHESGPDKQHLFALLCRPFRPQSATI
jgi:sterol desaturase/sphingolipid hydroxylase (fatty acid hydroxylase superfamily)